MSMETAWAVATTKPQAEEIAERSIREAGYEPWLPLYRKRLSGSRMEGHRRVRSRTDSVVLRPVFQRYLFVLLPYGDAAYAIDAARGVQGLLRYSAAAGENWGKPKIMRARVVLQLREAVEAGAFDEIRDTATLGFKISDRVRTTAGIVGTLIALDARGRGDLLTELMGATRLVRGVEAGGLELVSA